jgi:hypothetical protein
MTAMKTLDERLLAGILPGTWAAISSNQETVVATGNTPEDALNSAREKGETAPFIVRVPLEDSALIL